MMKLPQARTTEIVVQDLGRELLIYDLKSHKAYTLNETSKIIFESCDGRTSFDELRRRHKFTADLIHLALDNLKTHDLLENYANSHFAGLSRREIIRRVGLGTAVALPVIASLVAPKSAAAVSRALVANGQLCTDDTQCVSSCCGATARNEEDQTCVNRFQKSQASYCRVNNDATNFTCECQSLCCISHACEPGNKIRGARCVASCQCSSKNCQSDGTCA